MLYSSCASQRVRWSRSIPRQGVGLGLIPHWRTDLQGVFPKTSQQILQRRIPFAFAWCIVYQRLRSHVLRNTRRNLCHIRQRNFFRSVMQFVRRSDSIKKISLPVLMDFWQSNAVATRSRQWQGGEAECPDLTFGVFLIILWRRVVYFCHRRKVIERKWYQWRVEHHSANIFV